MNHTTIAITLNGESKRIASGTSVAELVDALGNPPAAFATAVNGDFLARSARAERVLRDGDALFVFQPITGG